MTPRIKVFCFFYNEEFLIPFFLSHYQFADKIHAFVSRSSDRTRELLEVDPRVDIQEVEFPQGMDDLMKSKWQNSSLQQHDTDHDWHIVVDADEFVWPHGDPSADTARLFLRDVPEDQVALMVRMWNVFRHRSDSDLDPSDSPVVLQRRHGIAGRGGENAPYQKPIVIRPNLGLQLSFGNHQLLVDRRRVVGKLSDTHEFQGAHWQNADPSFCITRRIRDRKERQSADNLRHRLGIQHHHISEADVRQHCLNHSNDPQIF
jgi:hypothetical protein